MKFLDLLTMSVGNLRRRKLRTFLTVLGVVIGTASIMVMVSLGIGLNALTVEQYASFGSLTEVSIFSDAFYGGGQDGKTEPNFLTDQVIKKFAKIAHVKYATPMFNTNVLMKQGAYQGNVNMIGVARDYMENIPLKEGHLPEKKAQTLEMVVGSEVPQSFYNPKDRGGGRRAIRIGGNSAKDQKPKVDFLHKPMFVIFDTNKYYQSQGGGTAQDGTPVKPPKKYLIPTVGIIDPGELGQNRFSYGVYVDIDALKTQLKQIFKKNPIPGQPTNKKGKPYNYFIYDQAVVEVDDMKNVIQVMNEIKKMGFQANSNVEWLQQSQKQYQMVQAVLGGIGAVSLLVAAIGIANTMMMSIYERTREIGIIKVLGCDMHNIRTMFLIESGVIGFMGGLAGTILSYGVSALMNQFLSGKFLRGIPGDISRIPLWLAGASVLFAIFVGMAAGFFPALRAMRLSPLAAIRNE